jgi:hypothetical protein
MGKNQWLNERNEWRGIDATHTYPSYAERRRLREERRQQPEVPAYSECRSGCESWRGYNRAIDIANDRDECNSSNRPRSYPRTACGMCQNYIDHRLAQNSEFEQPDDILPTEVMRREVHFRTEWL